LNGQGAWTTPSSAFGYVVDAPTGVAATDKANIQTALDSARTAGGGTVYLQNGTYVVSIAAHPVTGGYNCALTIGAMTKLVLMPGTVIQLAASQTNGNDVSGINAIVMNYTLTGGDSNIVIQGGTFDGNAANQTHTQEGITFLRTNHTLCDGVTVMNCRGTAGSGVNEAFFFEATLASEASYVNCTAARTAGSTATGFSSNGGTNILWSNCRAYGMSVAHGFTAYNCYNVQWDNCRSWLNAGIGMNVEYSHNAIWNNCISGGGAAYGSENGVYSSLENLGNGTHGFVNLGSEVEANGCISTHNTQRGMMINDDLTGAPSGAACRTIINGGYFGYNDYGISVLTTTQSTSISSTTVFEGNTSGSALYLSSIGSGINDYVLPSPSVPASTVALTNPFPFNVEVVVSTAGVTAVTLDGVSKSAPIPTTFILPPCKTVALTHGGGVTWHWFRA